MYKFIIKTCLLVTMVFGSNSINAQVSTSRRVKYDSIRTEVFILETCDPSLASFSRLNPDPSNKRNNNKKLEIKSKKLSAIQINGINPLRYKYFINNEAVTQFMEPAVSAFSINSFVNGDYLPTAPELKVPEIFKTDSITSNVKAKIREFDSKNKELSKMLDDTTYAIDVMWYKVSDSVYANNPEATNVENDKKSETIVFTIPRYQNLQNSRTRITLQKERNLKEFEIYTGGLPLNNPKFGILMEYRNMAFDRDAEPEIAKIKTAQKAFADQYQQDLKNFTAIDSLVEILLGSRDPFHHPAYEKYLTLVRIYNFSISKFKPLNSNSNEEVFNVRDLKEQILAKQFQLYEEFVLNIAMQMGVLIQHQFRHYSAFNNELENMSCISKEKLDTIQSKKKALINTFDFIQKTSAELQILVSYLDINTVLYQSIAKSINSNYFFLLTYLKNMEYVTKQNSYQYTLPTHTNLKNIDLLRYNIKREDKITKTVQNYNYDFWVKGGIKIDFSVGFFGTQLTDNKYGKVLLDTAGGIDKIRITLQDDGKTDFAFGGMVNVAPRLGGSWLNLGGSIGVAYSSNQKLQILTGIALHLGKTERLIVHAGAAFGTVKYIDISANDFKFYDRNLKEYSREQLNEVDEKDRVYMLESPDVKFSGFTVPTIDKFIVKPFVGISYNLSKKNALQAVSGNGLNAYNQALNGTGK